MVNILAFVKLVWERRVAALCCLVLALLLVIWGLLGRLQAAGAALAAKPKVETKVETKVVEKVVTKVETRVVAGPERVVEKEVRGPDQVVYIDRIIERGPVTTETGTKTEAQKDSDKVAERTQEPVCPQGARAPRWIVGASVPAAEPKNMDKAAVKVGVTFFNRVDVMAGYQLSGQDRVRVDANLRF